MAATAQTHNLLFGWNDGDPARALAHSKSVSQVGQTVDFEEDIPAATDTQFVVPMDVSAVKAFYMVADVAMTVEINSSGGAGGSITLVAGVPYVWCTSSYDTFKFGTDWTSIYVTAASAGVLKIKALVDTSP